MKGAAGICVTVWLLLYCSKGLGQRVDCQWGPFSEWTSCDGCEKSQSRSRSIAVYSQNGGNPCFGETSETNTCFWFIFEMLGLMRRTCTNVDLRVHCQWGPFGDWSECDGCTGKQTRTRPMAVYAQNGGNPCGGDWTETRSCETNKSCPLEHGCGDRFRCRSGMCLPLSLRCNGDQDCEEDNEDEGSCGRKEHHVCPLQRPPPNVERIGVGVDLATGKDRGIVINTKSFGGQCRRVDNNAFRLPQCLLRFNSLVTIQNDKSDEMFQSEWHYVKDIVKRETVTGTTKGFRNYDYHERDVRTRNFRLLDLKNDIEIATFQMTSAEFIPIAEEFWKALTKLPAVYNYAAYRELLIRFGTHYTWEGSLGGSLRVIARLDSDIKTRSVTEFSAYKECEKVTRFFLFFEISHEKCKEDSSNPLRDPTVQEHLNRTTFVAKTTPEGGSPALISKMEDIRISTPDTNWRTYTDWADSIKSFPKVIKSKLKPLWELVKEVHCAGVKRLFLRKAIEQYLSESHPCHCLPCPRNGVAVIQNNICKCIPKPGSEAQDPNTLEVDGSWSCWSPWASCSGGRKTRSRACNNPAPQNGGQHCIGKVSETDECDEDALDHLRHIEPECFHFSIPAKLKCAAPPALINGYILEPRDTYLVGDRVEYRCITGFHLTGPSIFECTAAQTWSGEPAVCQLSNCLMPELAADVLVSPDKFNYEIGDTVTLSCPEGKELKGERTAICDPSLNFSPDPTQVSCKQVKSSSGSGTAPVSTKCAAWENEVRGQCICKLPSECGPSLQLCAAHPLIGTYLLTVCQLHAFRCSQGAAGAAYTLADNSACVWPARPAAPGCTQCHPWETCDGQSGACVCRAAADCPSPGLSVCVRVGGAAADPQTMTECEAGRRRCSGEQVMVVDIVPCSE